VLHGFGERGDDPAVEVVEEIDERENDEAGARGLERLALRAVLLGE